MQKASAEGYDGCCSVDWNLSKLWNILATMNERGQMRRGRMGQEYSGKGWDMTKRLEQSVNEEHDQSAYAKYMFFDFELAMMYIEQM